MRHHINYEGNALKSSPVTLGRSSVRAAWGFGKKLYVVIIIYFIKCVDKGVSLSNTYSSMLSPPRDGKSYQWQLTGFQEEPM